MRGRKGNAAGKMGGRPRMIAEAGLPLHPSGKCPIIMTAEETALRFLPAAMPAQFHKNGSKEPFLWNPVIVTMRISTGAPLRSRRGCKALDNLVQNLAPEQSQWTLKALAFKAFGFVQYA